VVVVQVEEVLELVGGQQEAVQVVVVVLMQVQY
jgi:hypothetical protein